ncbi:TonB-dependent receptor [Altererythrobacter indicus]|uniref:TonB-dependent receptor n=1 Tax=Altericroceibacterium indicum TaxID=374177 RepID=A0A845A7Y8_9SPHN|nr:TonB-dependent receptor [Altericroceibacterium indicum]MXP25804.1 TonB-dependent receptor [Altericroceibacterium indicum]
MTSRIQFKVGLLSATFISSVMMAVPAMAEDATAGVAADSTVADDEDTIIVTGTRRATTLMDTPINITAIGANELNSERIDDIRDISDFIPGMTVSDTGAGTTGSIVLRGLNASDVGDGGTNYDDSLGIYLGEVPLYYDFKLLDIERVEVLLGPQGTLFGLGTLAGNIRYIPNRPNATSFEMAAHGRTYVKSHSGDIGYQVDAMVNVPIVQDHIAFRTSTGYYYDPGFIDYPLLVKEPGVSLPQPDGPDSISEAGYDANLYKKKDLNFEKTFTTRNQLLLQTSEDLKLTLTYAYQQTKTDGAQSNSAGVLGTGRYENASRFEEPVNRHAHLASAEVNANIADIVDLVATGAYTETVYHGKADVTDLLLDLDYDYELFPAFAAWNESDTKRKQKNAEIRFVSRHGGPFRWVLGGFYNENKYHSDYAEHIPNHPWVDAASNPEALEYVSYVESKVTEKAIFGEGTFNVTPQWQLTAGARYYKYTSSLSGAAALPVLGDPLSPYDLPANGGKAGKSGWVWKFNSSYNFSPDFMVYGTYSKGYRIGGPNRVAPCPADIKPGQQIICALPDEMQYGPDTTKNIELGTRMQLLDRKVTLNFNLFHIDWKGIQLDSATLYGATGITVNGGSGKSKGFETSFSVRPATGLSVQGTYSYTDAKLTEDVPGILTIRTTPGDYSNRFTQLDALSGDRLPGSAKHSGSLGATYTMPLGDGDLTANWTATYRGNIVTRLGWDRAYGDKLPGYTTHRASLTYDWDDFSLTLFANNIFDKYAVVSVANDRSRIGVNDGVAVRYYRQAVLNPRTVGIEGRMKF